MKTYQIPAAHRGMTEEESRALTAFEQAHADYSQPAFGPFASSTREEIKWAIERRAL